MKGALAWLEQRTGLGRCARGILYENIPGGARWRHVWGNALVFAIGIQFVTGIFLWMNYSPGAQSAWESVNHIQNEMAGGWLLRGLHHYTAQFMMVLVALHLLAMIVNGAYKAPREVNFWVAIVLLQCVALMALTGYQLPWDQKGFGATKVLVNLVGIIPLVGESLQRILIGGVDYGHLTLTRFFGIHAGVLPAAIIALMAAQFYLFRRHGFAGDASKKRPDAPFWPDQALRDAVVCLAFVGTVLFLTVRHAAPLSAPADPSEPFNAARPEWSFLFMFQFLKLFPGRSEIFGAFVIPAVVILVILLMPFIGRTSRGHRFNVAFVSFLFCAAGVLIMLAKSADAKNPEYQLAVREADRDAARARMLAKSEGIPPGGALALLLHDPYTQGPRLFARNCASCHRFGGHDGTGRPVKDAQSASDLTGFGSREWLEGLLDPAHVSSTNYFGATKFKDGKMSKFVKKDVAAYSSEQKEQLKKVIAAVSAEAGLKSQASADSRDATMIAEGRTLLKDAMACTDCHQFRAKDDEATAPDLTGYGSRDWLVRFLGNSAHKDFYGTRNDRMPAFAEKQILTPEAIGLLADWLRGDWLEK